MKEKIFNYFLPNEKVSKLCHFCYVFNREWKWKESVIGYIGIWTTYPNTMDYPICWKCACLWRLSYQELTHKKDDNWLHSYEEPVRY